MTAPTLTLDGETILADGVALLSIAGDRVVALFDGAIWWWWELDKSDDGPGRALEHLSWAIKCSHQRVSMATVTCLRLAGDNIMAAYVEDDPATRAPFLREFDRLMQVAAIWRRFIP